MSSVFLQKFDFLSAYDQKKTGTALHTGLFWLFSGWCKTELHPVQWYRKLFRRS